MTPPPDLQQLIDTVFQDAGSDDAITQLATAAAAAAQLEETTDALLGYFVDRCRKDGRSWSEISVALGVTKQAVHKRFAGAVAAHLIAANPAPTFERFTDRARHVVAAARQAARAAGDAVSSQHILIGLFAEPAGLACRALTNLRVSEADVRAAAGAGASAGEDASGTLPQFAEEGKQALADALTIALELGHNYIGTEHMLLGLYRNAASPAAQILTGLGTSEVTAKAEIMEMLREFQQRS